MHMRQSLEYRRWNVDYYKEDILSNPSMALHSATLTGMHENQLMHN